MPLPNVNPLSSATRALGSLLLLLALAHQIACARIYRPITVAPAPIHAVPGEVRSSVAFQSWGDNSRYMKRAHGERVRLMVLAVANGTEHEVQVTLDPGSVPGEWLSPAKACALVRQGYLGFALYPVGSQALIPPWQTGAWSELANAIAAVSFGATLTVALSNAAVAASSNRKLEAFFTQKAWTDGGIPPGTTRQGLLLFRPHDPRAAATLRFQVVEASGSRTVELPLPGEPAP
jgi:hypothetical protein